MEKVNQDNEINSITIQEIQNVILDHLINHYGWGEKIFEDNQMDADIAKYIVNSTLVYLTDLLLGYLQE